MKFITHQHRFGLDIIHSDERLKTLWNDIETTLNGLTDERIIDEYKLSENAMSISNAINNLIDNDLQKFENFIENIDCTYRWYISGTPFTTFNFTYKYDPVSKSFANFPILPSNKDFK